MKEGQKESGRLDRITVTFKWCEKKAKEPEKLALYPVQFPFQLVCFAEGVPKIIQLEIPCESH